MCNNNFKEQFRQNISKPFKAQIGVRQGDLVLILFNIPLERVTRNMK